MVLVRSLQIKTFRRIILGVLPVRGTQHWRNTKFIQCKVNVYRCKYQAGCKLAVNDLICRDLPVCMPDFQMKAKELILERKRSNLLCNYQSVPLGRNVHS